MTPKDHQRLGAELYGALRDLRTIDPLTERFPSMSVADAYHISLAMVNRRVEDGEVVVGKKIGVTSKPVQDMLDVHTPDFGYLTDAMAYRSGSTIPISQQMIQPRAEGEIAFRLARGLKGPGVTGADVLAATECVIACFEIVDSRIHDWRIRYRDTVSDNASSGVFILGDEADPAACDLATVEMVVEKNGEFLSRGTGEKALTGSPKLGSPEVCVAWLANTLAEFGIGMEAGEVILSGSLVPLEPVVAGDDMRMEIAGLGAVSVSFS